MLPALILFARRPTLGHVKTRLAATIGDTAALRIYRRLLDLTFSVAANVPSTRYLFLTGTGESLSPQRFQTIEQSNGDLGERMMHAFQTVFNKGHERAVIIGTDCPGLTTAHLEEAFALLRAHDAVIGPATDGGYYLLGLKEARSELFRDKAWSTASVFEETIKDFERLGWRYEILPTLADVDTAADLPAGWL